MPESRAVASSSRSQQSRVDTESLRLQNPIVDVVARYGVELRRRGSSFTGRCPFHADGGRPNLVVFPGSARWACFRCDARGDAIAFVQRMESISFREAASRLGGALAPGPVALTRRRLKTPRHCAVRRIDTDVLAAAVELYSNRLMTEPCALDYMACRGFGRELLEQERIGFAVGGELVPYLAWRGVWSHRARRAGLLDANGREMMEGRIVFPELRHGKPLWLIGRQLEINDDAPRYLGLAGGKPLLGWEWASLDLRGACLVEGPADWLALRMWGVPGMALCGTAVSPRIVETLKRWQRLYVVLDADNAGREATLRLRDAVGTSVIPVALPTGVKDPADLATRTDGAALFAKAIRGALATV
jgi:DNA primase catalytic core